jgi:hyperosmotically inducible protein
MRGIRIPANFMIAGISSAWAGRCIIILVILGISDGRKETEMKTRLWWVGIVFLAIAPASLLAQREVSPAAEARIQKEVRHELVMLPYLTVFDNLAYKVEGYNVTLFGQVTQPVLKSDAEKAVKKIEGVEHVDNQIEVLPLSPMDDRLRRQLYRAIYGYSALQRYAMPVLKPIRIIVKNGHATLEGVVDSEADKNLAGLRANGVGGVFSVTNNLKVVKP